MEQGEIMAAHLTRPQSGDRGLSEGHMLSECPSDHESLSHSAATTPSPLPHHIASSSTSQPLSSPTDTGSPSSSNGALTIAYPNSPSANNGLNMAVVPYSTAPSTPSSTSGGDMNVVNSTSDSFRPYHQDLKYVIEELCPVCGDKVSGYHYGLLTCESCKGFFKRTVQNKKVYSCVDNRSCAIDKSQRKRCPYCRFQKCLRVGMKLEAVRQDRMRGGRNKFGPMYKRDRALKQQAVRQQHHMLGIPPPEMRPDMAMLSPNGHIPFSHPGMTSYIPQGSLMASMPPLTPAIAHGGAIRHVPPLIEQLKSHEPNEKDLQEKVFAFAQYHFASSDVKPKQELILGLCKLADHCLFLLVEWARGSLFFRELKVEDQMKLLQNCWSELLIIEYTYRQMRSLKTYLHSFDSVSQLEALPQLQHLEFLPRLGLPDIRIRLFELIKLFAELNMDQNEYVCLKSLLLLNPDILGLDQRQFIEESQEKINAGLLEYCVRFHPEVKDKFGQLLLRLSEIRIISIRAEEFLYNKHVNGDVLGQTLLLEMLHSKRK